MVPASASRSMVSSISCPLWQRRRTPVPRDPARSRRSPLVQELNRPGTGTELVRRAALRRNRHTGEGRYPDLSSLCLMGLDPGLRRDDDVGSSRRESGLVYGWHPEAMMAERSYGQFCPVAMAAEILCTRWTVVLLRELVAGSSRFNDLRRGVPRMSPALLSQRLKELECAGIVSRLPSASEAGIFEYRLTEAGRELEPLVEAFGRWGQRWVTSELSLEKLDASLLM